MLKLDLEACFNKRKGEINGLLNAATESFGMPWIPSVCNHLLTEKHVTVSLHKLVCTCRYSIVEGFPQTDVIQCFTFWRAILSRLWSWDNVMLIQQMVAMDCSINNQSYLKQSDSLPCFYTWVCLVRLLCKLLFTLYFSVHSWNLDSDEEYYSWKTSKIINIII